MKTLSIACLGPQGSFTSSLVSDHFPEAKQKYMPTYEGCQAAKSSFVDKAVFPLENNTGGFVYDTLRGLYQTAKISVMDIIHVDIQQNLVSRCEKLADIRMVLSHPNAIAQCQKKIDQLQHEVGHELQIVKTSSTSQAVMEAAKNNQIAAIASQKAAELYQVPVVLPDFQDKKRNETRFAVMQMGKIAEPTGKDKTLILVEVEGNGSLAQVISLIASFSLSIASLTPFPVYRNAGPWGYAFFIEISGHASQEPVKTLHRTLSSKRLRGQTRKARLLGSYPNRLGFS